VSILKLRFQHVHDDYLLRGMRSNRLKGEVFIGAGRSEHHGGDVDDVEWWWRFSAIREVVVTEKGGVQVWVELMTMDNRLCKKLLQGRQ
jgi:hypothetical protein